MKLEERKKIFQGLEIKFREKRKKLFNGIKINEGKKISYELEIN